MVDFTFAKVGADQTAAPHSIERDIQIRNAEARLRQLGADFKAAERTSPVEVDFRNFWNRKIIAAMNSRQYEVHNGGWVFNGRCDEQYIAALQELLGPEFTVEFTKGQWGGKGTKVSW